MFLEPIITAYLIPFMGLVFLISLIIINPLFSKQQTAFFLIASILNIILIISTSFDYVFAELNVGLMWIFRRITTFMNFAFGPIIPILLLKIFDSHKNKKIFYIPAVLNIIICFISIFIPLIFFINSQNKYGRGPLFFIPFLTSIFYVALLLRKPGHYHMQNKKSEHVFLFAVMILLIASMFMEVKFKFKFLNYGCSSLALIMYYLLLNINGYIIDPLTGVYNRVSYNRALNEVAKSSRCIIALLDINYLKIVNDTYGHAAGDELLIKFVHLLYERMGKISKFYRIGGDEFVLISKKKELEDFINELEQARIDISKQDVHFAYGVVEYKQDDDINLALKLVDEKMYAFKSEMKKKTF